jgi:DNA (cytosine-5)-methyltransferase 1
MDKFCQQVLKKHWPLVPIIEDVNNVEAITNAIRERRYATVTPTGSIGINMGGCVSTGEGRAQEDSRILTAGFPCQPFSNAGRKRGSSDSRYLWPQTLAVIEAIKPDWVILENVPGILNMVFPDSEVGVASQSTLFGVENDEICDYSTISGRIERDLRQAGYETVWLVISACGVGAPHRRDRVWIVGNSTGNGLHGTKDRESNQEGINRNPSGEDQVCQSERTDSTRDTITNHIDNLRKPGVSRQKQRGMADEDKQDVSYAADTPCGQPWKQTQQKMGQGISRGNSESGITGNTTGNPSNQIGSVQEGQATEPRGSGRNVIPGWSENWYEVATRFCRVSDGIPNRVDRLKSLGNAIVPAVAYQLIKAIQEANE